MLRTPALIIAVLVSAAPAAAALRTDAVFFVVWQQARENDLVPGGFRFGRDTNVIFGAPPQNVFLVKLAYWLNG